MTHRMFYDDQYLRSFASPIVKRLTHDGKPAVILERTAFYPTSGGQPHDTGSLNGLRVIDVVEQGEAIVHVLEAELPPAEMAKGLIDWDRRLDHLQQHHGQHILSEAFIQAAGADTTSFHLGAETCSVDLEKPYVAPEQVVEAERIANRIVMEDRETSIFYASKEDIAKLPFRKPPPVVDKLRVVQVKDFDCSACCGTHPRRTGEVGPILVLGAERGKSMARVTFVCGWRAINIARKDVAILKSNGAKISAGRDDFDAAVQRILDERLAANKALQLAEKQLATYKAKEMAGAATAHPKGKLVSEIFENRDMKYLQMVANEIIAQPGHIVLLGGTGETSAVVLARSADVSVDLKPIGAEVFKSLEGKGGGSPSFQQGGGKGKDLAGALKLALSKL